MSLGSYGNSIEIPCGFTDCCYKTDFLPEAAAVEQLKTHKAIHKENVPSLGVKSENSSIKRQYTAATVVNFKYITQEPFPLYLHRGRSQQNLLAIGVALLFVLVFYLFMWFMLQSRPGCI